MGVRLLETITPWDVAYVVRHMRQVDMNELIAFTGQSPYQVLEESVEHSAFTRLALRDGQPAALFGFVPLPTPGSAMPWMVGTPAASGDAANLTRIARRVIDEARQAFPYLVNFVDARNKAAVRWLRYMGFTVHDPEPQGVLGLPFHRFEMV